MNDSSRRTGQGGRRTLGRSSAAPRRKQPTSGRKAIPDGMRAVAASMRNEAPTGATHALVSAALVRDPADEVLGVVVVVGCPGRPGRLIGLNLGRFEDDPLDDTLCVAADNVIWVREFGGLTKREGAEQRNHLVAELQQHFASVQIFDDDVSLAEANALIFPCTKANELLRTTRAEDLGSMNGPNSWCLPPIG